MSKVAILKTTPERVIEDYRRVMELADYQKYLPAEKDTLLKLNLSWTKYFPACSSQPWQVEGVINTLLKAGYKKEKLLPVENKTVVTDPLAGSRNNRWDSVFAKYDLNFQPLTEVSWEKLNIKSELLVLDKIFPAGIMVPTMFAGKNVLHLPTVKTHGHSITTGAIKNSFGGLLKEVRHHCHKHIHEVLVDLMIIQHELHSGIFAVMDGTVCGNGAGPRTMLPVVKNLILASGDSVAIDAVAAKLMGFDPLSIPYIRLCHELKLGTGDIKDIEIVGEDIAEENFAFETKKSLVIWGDQLLRKGRLKFLERLLLHTKLVAWAPLASNIYHDLLWYPVIGQSRIKEFNQTGWGKLFQQYEKV